MTAHRTFLDFLKAPASQATRPSVVRRFISSDWARTKSTTMSATCCDDELVLWIQSQNRTTDGIGGGILGVAARRNRSTVRPVLLPMVSRLNGEPHQVERRISITSDCRPVALLRSLDFQPSYETVWVLDGSDKRAPFVDLGETVCAPAITHALANLLFPDKPDITNPEFRATARRLVVAAVSDLNISGAQWLIGDLLDALALSTKGAEANHQSPVRSRLRSRRLVAERFGSEMLSILGTVLNPFTAIADLSAIACMGVWLLAGLLYPYRVRQDLIAGSAAKPGQMCRGGVD